MRALAVLLLSWLVSPAQAADIYAFNLLGTTIIRIDGTIMPGDEQKFARLNYPTPLYGLQAPVVPLARPWTSSK